MTEKDFIGVRFSEEDSPKGWEILDKEINIIHIILVNKPPGIAYLFTTANWEGIRKRFIEENINFAFQKGSPSIHRKDLENLNIVEEGKDI